MSPLQGSIYLITYIPRVCTLGWCQPLWGCPHPYRAIPSCSCHIITKHHHIVTKHPAPQRNTRIVTKHLVKVWSALKGVTPAQGANPGDIRIKNIRALKGRHTAKAPSAANHHPTRISHHIRYHPFATTTNIHL